VKKVDPSGTTYYIGGIYEKMEASGVVTTTGYYTDIVPCQVARLSQCDRGRQAKRAR
jgi:hypothetical protein